MKKISMILGGAILVLAAGCQKLGEGMTPDNTDAPQAGESQKVELFATLPVTRTTLSTDFKLSWNKSEQIAVFNAPTGTDEYSENIKFTIDEDVTGIFSPVEGAVVPFEDGVNYDWFVCCPYRVLNGVPELKTPKGETKDDGYFPIGAQTQNGYNSTAHIGGADVMVGKAANTRTPDVALKHLAVLHRFTVTNNSDKPTVITKLTLNGGENKLFGTFRLDLRSDNPVISADNANNTYAERALTVNDGTDLAVGASADFYMMTAPFTLNAGETFKVTIETTTGTQVVEKTATTDIEFSAGTYNTASLVYDYVPNYADHLYYDTFYDSTSTLASNTTFNEGSVSSRWKSYLADLSGLSVYDGAKEYISYTWTWCQPSAQVAASALVGMDGLHLWFKAEENDASLIVSGIKLHGYTDLNLSFVQTYKGSGLRIDYMVDNSESWQTIGETILENRTYEYNADFDFTVPENSKTIALRFTKTATAPRIDNIKLTWQAE